jgi:signal transduction histidine kinase
VSCDLNAVLSDAVRLIEISPERRPEHLISFTPGERPVRVAIAEEELMQVLWNLARNGLEAMPRGGTLAFTVRSVPDAIEVEVSDEGHGMERRRLAQIFEPLRTSKARGTGLGLAIAHRLVRARGGDLLISSEPSRGTKVRIRLLVEATTHAAPAPPEAVA